LSKRIYTIGSSLREIEEFLQLLRQYDVQDLVDVRSFPTSKFTHFCQKELKASLTTKGIRYIYLGKELGGYRRGGYEKHMQTDAFRQGLEKLGKIARSGNSSIMCAERFPWRCHRRFISLALQERGWEVIHIIDSEKIWQPKKPQKELAKLSEGDEQELF